MSEKNLKKNISIKSFMLKSAGLALAALTLGFSSQASASVTRTCPVKLSFSVGGSSHIYFFDGISGTAGTVYLARVRSKQNTAGSLSSSADYYNRVSKYIPNGASVRVTGWTFNNNGSGCNGDKFSRVVNGTGPGIFN